MANDVRSLKTVLCIGIGVSFGVGVGTVVDVATVFVRHFPVPEMHMSLCMDLLDF